MRQARRQASKTASCNVSDCVTGSGRQPQGAAGTPFFPG